MRNLAVLLLLLVALGPPARGQQGTTIPAQANLTASDGGTCTQTTAGCIVVNISNNAASSVVQLTGTWSATVQFEATSKSGGTFVAINATPLGGTTAVTSASANGAWRINLSGVAQLRVRCSAFTSGTIVVAVTSSTGSSGSGGGGGGGGGINPPAGDICGTAGSPTVCGVNGATVPASAAIVGTNGSSQLVAEALANSDIFVGNGSNLPVAVAVSGDAALSNTGALTVTKTSGTAFGPFATQTAPCSAAQGCTGVASPTAHAEPVAEGASVYNFLGAGLTGQVKQTVNASDSIWNSPGIQGRSISGATDSILCDSATTLLDRLATEDYTDNAGIALTQPAHTTTGCTLNFTYLPATIGGGTSTLLTITPGGSDTINGQSTLVLGPNAWCSISNPANTIAWLARCANYVKAGANITPTFNADGSTSFAGNAGTVTSIATTAPLGGGTITGSGTLTCTTCTTNASALTSNILVKGAGGQATQNSSVTDNGTTVSTTEPLSIGASPPTCTAGTAGGECFGEGTANTGAASVDNIYANSTAHCLDEIANNVELGCLQAQPAGLVTIQTITGADYTNTTVTPSTLFSWTLPATAVAKNYKYSCDIMWESTAATLVGPVFGLNISAAPTQLTGAASVQNTLAGADINGYLSNTTTGSQTLVTSSAAGVTSTNYWARIWGTIEGAPTAGATFIINAASTSGTTASLNVRRGGSCKLERVQ